jgi:hypothetical protein
VESLFTASLHFSDFVQTQNDAKILTYKEIEPFNLNANHDVDVTNENISGACIGVPATIVHFEKYVRCVC